MEQIFKDSKVQKAYEDLYKILKEKDYDIMQHFCK